MNGSKRKILIVLIFILFILLIGLTIFKFNNAGYEINKNSEIEDITLDSKKVNVYFFWGDGCPHCAEEFAYLEKHYKKYKDYCNIYAFEVWNNSKNADLMAKCGEILNEEFNGVPLTIIGKEKIIGFGDKAIAEFDKILKQEYEKKERYDIYNEIKEERDEK